jgi:hypothetical protein
MNNDSPLAGGSPQVKNRYRLILGICFGVIAVITLMVIAIGLLLPRSLPAIHDTIAQAGPYFLVIRWALYASIWFKFTEICRYLSPGASAEKIAYARQYIVGLMVLYELLAGADLLRYGFDIVFN